MGDRGGKKGKEKSQKQKMHKHELEEIKKQDKQRKNIQVPGSGKNGWHQSRKSKQAMLKDASDVKQREIL